MTDRNIGIWGSWAMLAGLLLGGCRGDREPGVDASIAVTSPYLEAAIRDLLPKNVPPVRLAGPSMCPGHFDMRPSQIGELARCRLLVRFDFQQPLDDKLADRASASPATLSVVLSGGMCEPDTYLAACRQIAEHFVSVGEMEKAAAERRLAEIGRRMDALAEATRRRIEAAGLRDAAVLSSGHQAAFCRWLGLRTVATFSGEDTAGTGEIDRAVKAGQSAGARIIVANQPEGRRLADALADRLDARVAVFANFPQPDEAEAFDNLLRRNLAALLETNPPGENGP